MYAQWAVRLPVFALLAGLAGCLPRSEVTEYTASDSGRTVMLASGTHFKVRLASNATTGYAWELRALDETIVAQVGNQYIAPDTDLVGAGGAEEWEFAAQAAGTTTLQMEYRRSWEPDTPAPETFELTIQVVTSGS
jgi:inhibitor of cysteine peptidase